jgi:hypothetical protein
MQTDARMTRDRGAFDRRLGWALVLVGAVLALAIQVAGPVGVPLYDGVVVQEPYRFLHPANADQAGDPTRYEETKVVGGDVSPQFAAATGEQPPQAQLIALGNAFQLTAGATDLRIVVEPVDPPAPPASGSIAGNAYRFVVADQAGNPITPKACEGCLSMVLRAPDGTGEATLMRYSNEGWTKVETIHAGTTGLYQTNPTALGIYAVVTTGSGGGGGSGGQLGLDPIVIVLGGAVVVLVLAVAGYLAWRRRGGDAGTDPAPIPSNRVPTKRKRPRGPSGRSDR